MRKMLKSIILIFIISFFSSIYINAEDISKENFLDDIIEDFINEQKLDLSQYIDSKVYLKYLQINKNKVDNINDKINTQVYTFKPFEDEKVYTIISLDFPEDIYISKEDVININTNLYFENPKVILLGKYKEEDEWKRKDIIASTTLDEISIHSDQIKNNYKYFKVIIGFSSIINDYVINDSIYYNINYFNYNIYKGMYEINVFELILIVIILYVLFKIFKFKIKR